MKTTVQTYSTPVIIQQKNIDIFFSTFKKFGYIIIGPTVRDGAIIYDTIDSSSELPIGWTEEQNAATYRLKKQTDDTLFGFNSTPQSWKRFIHPPTAQIWKSKLSGKKITIAEKKDKPNKFAFFGVRPCDLSAIQTLDKVFINSPFTDISYKSQRANIFIVVVNCTQAGGTCFCASMNTGPKATTGFDLSITEILEQKDHYFIAEAGSENGEDFLKNIPNEKASDKEIEAANNLFAKTSSRMERYVDVTEIKSILYKNSENKRWHEIAKRCLSCSNCTMVCPTCFCTTIEDVTDLTGSEAERIRKWDSCFSTDFSYIHGGSIRPSVYARYRQWLTHKFASWQDQFGSYGCVGCGRCITWCPVGIDITEELNEIRKNDQINPSTNSNKEK